MNQKVIYKQNKENLILLLKENTSSVLTIASIIAFLLWMLHSRLVSVTYGPIKLYKVINPSYYMGFTLLLLALIFRLFAKKRSNVLFSHPLFIVLLIEMYMQLPVLALFQYPLIDHTIHVTPIYYIIRNHNIDWPQYLGHRETVSPQLLMTFLMMVTNSYSVFTIHKLSLILLPTLTIIYMYLLSREAGLDPAKASLSAILALALAYQLFYFLRQTYTFPIYILASYLIMKLLGNRRYVTPLLILALVFISMDPAFVLVTLMALVVFLSLYYVLIKFIGRINVEPTTERRGLYLVVVVATILFGSYVLWIFNRYPYLPRDLYHKAEHAWTTAIKALHEQSTLISKSPAYSGKPTALGYNHYYEFLYRLKVFTRTATLGLGTLSTLLIFLSRKTKKIVNLLISSYFVVSAAIIVTKSYGAAVAPWAALMSWVISLLVVYNDKKIKLKRVASNTVILLCLILTILSVVIEPHILLAGGRIRIPEKDIYFLAWYNSYTENEQFKSFLVPGFGRWLSELSYIEFNKYPYFRDYFFYKGLGSMALLEISQDRSIVLAESSLEHFEVTKYAKGTFPWFLYLEAKISKDRNLIYNSGSPFVTVWFS